MKHSHLHDDSDSESDEPFVWHASTGETFTPAEMTTTHLFWSARMVFNHTVAESFRLHPFRLWTDVPSWPNELRWSAHTTFMDEIARRPKSDLTVEQRAEVEYMRRNRAAFEDALKEPPLPRSGTEGSPEDFADQDWGFNDEH